jgi:hypothetical protein
MDDTRRFRGLVGMSAVWGVALSALATSALAIGLATGLVPSSIYGARELIAVAIRGFTAGALGGGVFGWLLSRRARGYAISALSTKRVALWGFLATAGVPGILALAAGGPTLPLGILAASSLLAGVGGAGLAGATLRLARREARAERLPDPDAGESRLLP